MEADAEHFDRDAFLSEMKLLIAQAKNAQVASLSIPTLLSRSVLSEIRQGFGAGRGPPPVHHRTGEESSAGTAFAPLLCGSSRAFKSTLLNERCGSAELRSATSTRRRISRMSCSPSLFSSTQCTSTNFSPSLSPPFLPLSPHARIQGRCAASSPVTNACLLLLWRLDYHLFFFFSQLMEKYKE